VDHSLGEPVPFSSRIARFVRRNLTWLLGTAFTLLLLQEIFGTHGLIAMRRSQREASEVQKEINRIDEENRQLQERVQALRSDPAAIERIAREEMGLARPGEHIFKLSPKSGNSDLPKGSN
jgi:cell division protein FtsB